MWTGRKKAAASRAPPVHAGFLFWLQLAVDSSPTANVYAKAIVTMGVIGACSNPSHKCPIMVKAVMERPKRAKALTANRTWLSVDAGALPGANDSDVDATGGSNVVVVLTRCDMSVIDKSFSVAG